MATTMAVGRSFCLPYGGEYAGKGGWTDAEGYTDLELTGSNVLHQDDFEKASSSRGCIKCLDSTLLRWIAADEYVRRKNWQLGEGNHDKLSFKTLSADRHTGATSYLMKIDPRPDGRPYRHPGAHYSLVEEQWFIWEGELEIDGEGLYKENSYLLRPPGFVYGDLTSTTGATVFCKCEGPVRRESADRKQIGTNVLED